MREFITNTLITLAFLTFLAGVSVILSSLLQVTIEYHVSAKAMQECLKINSSYECFIKLER